MFSVEFLVLSFYSTLKTHHSIQTGIAIDQYTPPNKIEVLPYLSMYIVPLWHSIKKTTMSINKNNSFNKLMIPATDDGGVEMIPLFSEGDELFEGDKLPENLPILPVRNTVLFPGVIIPITVGRQKSIKLVKKVNKGDKILGVISQHNAKNEDPTADDFYKVGTIAVILKMIVLPDGNTTIIIQGKKRFEVEEYTQSEPFFTAKVKLLEENFPDKPSKEVKALVQAVRESAVKILKLNPEIPREAQIAIDNIDNPVFLTHFLSSNINVDVKEKQRLLEINDSLERTTELLSYMNKEIQYLELKQQINTKVHFDLDQQQRDYYLRQQIKVLQEELGQESVEQEEEKYRERALQKKWNEIVAKHFNKELAKISRLNPNSAEFPLQMNYVEFMLDLPWNEYTKDNFDLKRARKILDADHFGLEKVKERIIEYLAVLKLKKDLKAPILLLYGPPGVGKTSLGKSIAKSLNRKYVRMALGGLHDEAEIRGHRKTYIGAMCGKVIQGMKKASSSNPVFVLDEIDKLGGSHRGDPSSAMLEVLDPEQNAAFFDTYLEVEYDLSKVLFIATANSLDSIHPALLDRMEILEVNGYTLEEKVEIAKKFLVPKQKTEHGLTAKDVVLADDALVKIVDGYTRESGVRSLDRLIAKVIRKIAVKKATAEAYDKTLHAEDIITLLSPEYFDKDAYSDNETAGVVTGLAWTRVGGEILNIESSLSRGKGKLTLSGQLGDVMKESAVIALSCLKTKAHHYDIDYKVFDQFDLHVHVPAGAVPKDGPSAGITMFTSLLSVYTQRKVKEKLAMTGEITLTGKVLPVGGIKEKILAAKRAGITEIIMCAKNKKDVEEIEPRYIKNLIINYMTSVDEVVGIALLPQKVDNAMDLNVVALNENLTTA